MMNLSEVALTSDDTENSSSIYTWNVHTETILKSFKGSNSASHTLALIGNDYIISAQKEKPLLHIWNIKGKEDVHMKMVCPGRVTALSVTPDNSYCIAGIREKIFVWQISTGNLVAVLAKHYQAISCIRITDDGSYFISGAEDNLIHVWQLSSVLSEDVQIINGVHSSVNPLHTWSQHSLPVTDIYIGFGCLQARVVTCSLDQTCKLFDLVTGKLLLSIVFDVGLSSVTMDPAEHHLFAAGNDGRIFRVNLFAPPRTAEYHYSEDKLHTYEGHSKSVCSMAVSQNGSHLLTGSTDATAKLWHIPSCQCIRTLKHKGPVTNVMFVPAFESFFTWEATRPVCSIPNFKRTLQQSCLQETLESGEKQPAKMLMMLAGHNKRRMYPSTYEKDDYNLGDENDTSVDWKSIANKLLETNKQVYNFSVQRILCNVNNGHSK